MAKVPLLLNVANAPTQPEDEHGEPNQSKPHLISDFFGQNAAIIREAHTIPTSDVTGASTRFPQTTGTAVKATSEYYQKNINDPQAHRIFKIPTSL